MMYKLPKISTKLCTVKNIYREIYADDYKSSDPWIGGFRWGEWWSGVPPLKVNGRLN